jgi:hypothetical protein
MSFGQVLILTQILAIAFCGTITLSGKKTGPGFPTAIPLRAVALWENGLHSAASTEGFRAWGRSGILRLSYTTAGLNWNSALPKTSVDVWLFSSKNFLQLTRQSSPVSFQEIVMPSKSSTCQTVTPGGDCIALSLSRVDVAINIPDTNYIALIRSSSVSTVTPINNILYDVTTDSMTSFGLDYSSNAVSIDGYLLTPDIIVAAVWKDSPTAPASIAKVSFLRGNLQGIDYTLTNTDPISSSLLDSVTPRRYFVLHTRWDSSFIHTYDLIASIPSTTVVDKVATGGLIQTDITSSFLIDFKVFLYIGYFAETTTQYIIIYDKLDLFSAGIYQPAGMNEYASYTLLGGDIDQSTHTYYLSYYSLASKQFTVLSTVFDPCTELSSKYLGETTDDVTRDYYHNAVTQCNRNSCGLGGCWVRLAEKSVRGASEVVAVFDQRVASRPIGKLTMTLNKYRGSIATTVTLTPKEYAISLVDSTLTIQLLLSPMPRSWRLTLSWPGLVYSPIRSADYIKQLNGSVIVWENFVPQTILALTVASDITIWLLTIFTMFGLLSSQRGLTAWKLYSSWRHLPLLPGPYSEFLNKVFNSLLGTTSLASLLQKAINEKPNVNLCRNEPPEAFVLVDYACSYYANFGAETIFLCFALLFSLLVHHHLTKPKIHAYFKSARLRTFLHSLRTRYGPHYPLGLFFVLSQPVLTAVLTQFFRGATWSVTLFSGLVISLLTLVAYCSLVIALIRRGGMSGDSAEPTSLSLITQAPQHSLTPRSVPYPQYLFLLRSLLHPLLIPSFPYPQYLPSLLAALVDIGMVGIEWTRTGQRSEKSALGIGYATCALFAAARVVQAAAGGPADQELSGFGVVLGVVVLAYFGLYCLYTVYACSTALISAVNSFIAPIQISANESQLADTSTVMLNSNVNPEGAKDKILLTKGKVQFQEPVKSKESISRPEEFASASSQASFSNDSIDSADRKSYPSESVQERASVAFVGRPSTSAQQIPMSVSNPSQYILSKI